MFARLLVRVVCSCGLVGFVNAPYLTLVGFASLLVSCYVMRLCFDYCAGLVVLASIWVRACWLA